VFIHAVQRPALLPLTLFFLVLIWSAIAPKDRFTWWLEVLPGLVALVVLAATYRRFPFTPLAYWLVLGQCVILFVGGHYTYAEVPAFNWIREQVGGTRNNFDKLGHFAQGFVPAVIAREVLVRLDVVRKHGWLGFIVCAICLAISAAYEFVEWGVSVCTGEGGDAFLGTQGYVWDTQSDMLLALVGAIAFILTLSRTHDRQLAGIKNSAQA
jgi:putative membrane protein